MSDPHISIRPKNWGNFQHYKNRCPPWVKLHKEILSDYDFACLPIASKALAPLLWLLASEYQDGEINMTLGALSFRLHIEPALILEGIKPLIDKGFFISASDMLASCKQDACLETEREEETELSPIGDRQPSVDNCPHSEILDLYAKALPQLAQPLRSRWPSSAGANSLRVRWREDKRHQDLKFWEWFFGVVASSSFHLGQNDRGWKADLPWLLERKHFDKMLEKGVNNGR